MDGGHKRAVGRERLSHGSTRRHEAILELAAMDKADFAGALRRILTTDAEILGLERVNCWEIVVQPPGVRCVIGYLRSENRFEQGAAVAADRCPRYFGALTKNPVILANDARSDDRTSELTEGYLEPLGITSLMDVPVWVRGALWGVVCHEQVGPPRRWSQADRDFATSIGHLVSMAVEARERAAAERLVRGSEFLIGVLSHDLRSPLGSIRGSAEHLLQHSVDVSTSSAAERIVRSADRMTRLIEQLLDWTRIRTGRGMPLRRERTSLADLSRQVIADMRAAHPDSAIELEVLGDTLGEWDPDRVWQVLSNLVCNAVEHGTPAEPVQVRLDGSVPDRVVVEVGNRGELPSRVAAAFESLGQPEPGTDGLGLGLMITREIVAAHEGTLGVQRRPDETTFTVDLPRGS